ncbi:Pre-mRNA-processing protein 40C [Melia azedarach]|uniref:Pre-mRNA-processing protein 40C n=1 Tax=Melia azedarach TaxID=155640 RepID=A0ACC1XHL1_MELAZ|nr:Pre-mRNA-processing protein 40C [Melia azedarach]
MLIFLLGSSILLQAIPSQSARRALFEHYVKTRAEEERKEKRAAQKAAIEGFKQLLDETSEDIDHSTDYHTFRKKWGNDPRFEALDRKDRELLLNERVRPLKRAAEEKAQAIRAAAASGFKSVVREKGDITINSRWSKRVLWILGDKKSLFVFSFGTTFVSFKSLAAALSLSPCLRQNQFLSVDFLLFRRPEKSVSCPSVVPLLRRSWPHDLSIDRPTIPMLLLFLSGFHHQKPPKASVLLVFSVPLLPFGFAWLGVTCIVLGGFISDLHFSFSFSSSLSSFFFKKFFCVADMSDVGESQHSLADSGAVAPGNVAFSPISSSRTKRYKVRVGRGRSNATEESSEEGTDQSFFLDDEGTSEVLGIEPTIEDVHATFALTTTPKKSGLYYLRTYTGQSHLVPQVNPNTADKAWDDFGLSSLVIGARQWSRMGRQKWTRDISRDTDLKSVREYVATNPSETDIVTEERLAKVGLIPPLSSGAPGGEVPTPSSVTRWMAEGSKTDLAFLQLVRDRMAKAVGAPSQRAAVGSKGGHFAHASRAFPALKQVLEFSDSEKGSEVTGLNPDQAIDMASYLFLQGSFLISQFGDKLKEGSTSVGRVAKLEAQLSRLTQKVKDKDDQISKLEDQLGEARDEVTREFPDLDLHYMDFGFDRDALVAKFDKEQNPADAARSSRQLTLGHPLNLEVSPPHSDQEDDSDDQDDDGS